MLLVHSQFKKGLNKKAMHCLPTENRKMNPPHPTFNVRSPCWFLCPPNSQLFGYKVGQKMADQTLLLPPDPGVLRPTRVHKQFWIIPTNKT